MAMTGCASFAKVLLTIFNLIFFIIGVSLLGLGIWLITSPYKLDILSILDNPIVENSAYLIIVIGAFIVIVGFLGCCGACCENKASLMIYFVVVLLIFIIQLVAGCITVVFKDTVEEFVTTRLKSTMDSYVSVDSKDTYSTGWNAVQLVLECCGTGNYTDWKQTIWYEKAGHVNIGGTTIKKPYPTTCCTVDDIYDFSGGDYPTPINITACLGYQTTIPNARMNSQGCYESLQDWVISHALYVGAVGLGLAFLEIFCMVFAICVCRAITKDAEYGEEEQNGCCGGT